VTRWKRLPGRRRASGTLARARAGTLAAVALAVCGLQAVPASAAPQPAPPGTEANYSSGQSAPVSHAAAAPPDTPRLDDGYGPTGSEQNAMQAAAATAQSTGKPVVVSALTSPQQQITAQPGGGFSMVSNPQPVRALQHGAWVPVNLGLKHTSSNTLTPTVTAYGTVSFSAGGNAPLVTSRYNGVTMTVTWPTPLPAPTVNGTTATYPSVLPAVDLVVAATPTGGFADTLVVKSAAAAANPALKNLKLATKVTGGKLTGTSSTGLSIRDTHGQELMTAASPIMWDSNTRLPAKDAPSAGKITPDASDTTHPGLVARIAPVTATATPGSLSLKPDKDLLNSHGTVYPVFIDPTFNWHPNDPAAPAFDEVKQGCPSSKFYDNSQPVADSGRLGVGYNGWVEGDCDAGSEHAIYQWKLSSTLFGAHINKATVEATEVYSASCDSTSSGNFTVNLHQTGGISSGTDWSNRPKNSSYSTSLSFARASNPNSCPSRSNVSKGFNVLTPIKTNASGHAGSFTASLSEDSAESSHNDLGFSRFSNNPALQIEYNTPPSVPTASTMSAVAGSDDVACGTTSSYIGKTIATTPPVLRAKVSDKDGDKLQATFQYWTDGTTTKATGTSSDNIASGSNASFALPASFVSSLTNGTTVDWQVRVTDGEDSTSFTQSPTCQFTAEPTAPDAPSVTSTDNTFPNTDNGGTTGASAGTPGTFHVAATGSTTVTKFAYSLDLPPATSNPPSSQTAPAANNQADIKITPPSPGPHTLWVYALDAAGDDSGTTGYPFLAAGDAASTCASLTACYDNVGISADSNPGAADLDGSGDSYSATDLANAGWTSGGRVTVAGATFTLPAFGAGQKDNILAANQTVPFSGSGTALAFLATSSNSTLATPGAIANDDTAPYVPEGMTVSGSYCFSGTDPQGPCAAEGLITYTDGSTKNYDLTVPGWTIGDDSIAAVVLPHRNRTTGQTTTPHRLYVFSVPTDPNKTIASVTLPDVGNRIGNHAQALHIFSMATRNTTSGTAEASGTTVAAPSGQSWTGAWADPNEGQYNFQGGNFSDQTFRVALKPSISGSTVRVKLDNALGTDKLAIGHTTIATDSGSGTPSPLPTGTPTGLKFGGSQGVTIPAGGSVYSDPLTFPVAAGQYLLVSYQLTNSVPYLVQHSFANNAYEYLSAPGTGDKTTDTTGTPFAEQWQGWYTDLVTDLDVTSDHTPTQAVLGDGLIDAFQPNTHPETNGSRLSDALIDAGPTTPSPYGTIAEGIESNSLMTDNPQMDDGHAVGGPSVLSRIDRDILDQPGISNVIITEGLEDLLAGTTSDDLEANGYTALVQQLQGWGIATTLTSLTPCDGYTGSGASTNDPCTTTVDTARTDVNDWLSGSNVGGDAFSTPPVYFADFDGTVATPDTANGEEKLDAAADTSDHVNLTDAGYGAETTAILSPHDTWALNDGDGFPIANDTAPTDTPTTANDTTTGVGADTLTLGGTTNWTSDPTRGETLTFDGATGYASGQAALDTSRSYSVSAWVDPSSLPANDATIASQDGTANSPFALQYDAESGQWAMTLTKADAADPGTWQATGTKATPDAWTHLVGTYDAATKTARLYVNGTLAATATGVTSWNANGAFTIGRDLTDATDTHYFPGQISDVQAWNYTLSPQQITALHQDS
jgi:Concanavalin A-like lectin/glucanases superfamily